MNDLDLEATKSINQNLTLPKAFEQEKKRVFGANGGKRWRHSELENGK
jgi:hypothetical protein